MRARYTYIYIYTWYTIIIYRVRQLFGPGERWNLFFMYIMQFITYKCCAVWRREYNKNAAAKTTHEVVRRRRRRCSRRRRSSSIGGRARGRRPLCCGSDPDPTDGLCGRRPYGRRHFSVSSTLHLRPTRIGSQRPRSRFSGDAAAAAASVCRPPVIRSHRRSRSSPARSSHIQEVARTAYFYTFLSLNIIIPTKSQ